MQPLLFLWRALVMYFTVFVAIRLLGKRTMANLTPMDRVSGISFGTVAGSAAITTKVPLYGAMLVVGSFALISWIIGKLAVGLPGLRPLLMGKPRPLIQNGQVESGALKKAGLSHDDLLMRLREAQIAGPEAVQWAQLETDGKVGVIPKNRSS